VAATKLPDGVISPGGIGYDINCGVRLLALAARCGRRSAIRSTRWLQRSTSTAQRSGREGALKLSESELDSVCREGMRWALKRGYATEADLRRTEEGGSLVGADPSKVSRRARERGRPQLGSLGAGNHFIEIDIVDQVYDPHAAQVMGLAQGRLVVQIHCGRAGSATKSAPIT